MVRTPQSSLSLAQVVICAAGLILLAGLVLMAGTYPTYVRARDRHRLAVCLSNMGRIYKAIKMYEADHDEVPVEYGPTGTAQWQVMVAPYVKDRRIFLCEADQTHGEVYRWGAPYPCSYCYMYTMPNLMRGTPQPWTSSVIRHRRS